MTFSINTTNVTDGNRLAAELVYGGKVNVEGSEVPH